MNKLNESFNIPNRLFSFININTHFGDDVDLRNIQCYQAKNADELKQAYENDNEVFLIWYSFGELKAFFFNKSSGYKNQKFEDCLKSFIDGYIFTNVNDKSDLVVQRKLNKRGERHNTKNISKYNFSHKRNGQWDGNYTGYASLIDNDEKVIVDRSGYEIDFDKYIKKLNSIKRLSNVFEQKLVNIQKEYVDLLDEIYRKMISSYRQSLGFRDKLYKARNEYGNFFIKHINSDIEDKLTEIVNLYENYINVKKRYISASNQTENNINSKKSLFDLQKYLEELEKDINEQVKNFEEYLIDKKEQWNNFFYKDDTIEENTRTFKKVFEAVGESKLVYEYKGYKVYTKPFSKASIKKLAKLESNYEFPRNFNKYEYMIVNDDINGYLFFGSSDREYDCRNLVNFYGDDKNYEIIGEIMYNILAGYDYNDFIKQDFIERNATSFCKFVKTKEEAYEVFKHGYNTGYLGVAIVENGILDKLKFTEKDIINILTEKGIYSRVINKLYEKGYITPNIIANLTVDNVNSFQSVIVNLFGSLISDKEKEKTVKLIDPVNNKNLLLYLLVSQYNIGEYITYNQILQIFRQKLDYDGSRFNNSTFQSNVQDMLKKYKLPRDITNKMLLLANDKFNNNLNNQPFKNMSNIDANKIYKLLLSEPTVVKQALKDGMKIPDYMIEPIRRTLKLHGEKGILTKFNSIYTN